MKNKFFLLAALLIFCAVTLSAQTGTKQDNAVGKWKFEAPYAPEGYNTGLIEFSFAENKYSSSITFTGSDYKISGENTKLEKDTLTFSVYVEGNEVAISLKPDGKDKMTGKASYIEGEIPLTLTRDTQNK